MTRRVLAAALLVLLVACGGDDGDGDAAAFCERLDRLSTNDPFAALGSSATGAEVRVAFQALVERAKELVGEAPPEPRPAAERYEQAAVELESLLAGAGYDGSRVDTAAYRQAQLDYLDAADDLLRYFERGC